MLWLAGYFRGWKQLDPLIVASEIFWELKSDNLSMQWSESNHYELIYQYDHRETIQCWQEFYSLQVDMIDHTCAAADTAWLKFQPLRMYSELTVQSLSNDGSYNDIKLTVQSFVFLPFCNQLDPLTIVIVAYCYSSLWFAMLSVCSI
jgi:hypothetical protein